MADFITVYNGLPTGGFILVDRGFTVPLALGWASNSKAVAVKPLDSTLLFSHIIIVPKLGWLQLAPYFAIVFRLFIAQC